MNIYDANGMLADQVPLQATPTPHTPMREVGKCPQCKAATVFPRGDAEYCEECGWPDENRADTELQDKIKNATFLMVCSGENYSAEIVKGCDLHAKMMEAMFGDDKDCNPDERKAYAQELANPDNWHQDQDYGPTRYQTDVGETDHIEFLLITDPNIH